MTRVSFGNDRKHHYS